MKKKERQLRSFFNEWKPLDFVNSERNIANDAVGADFTILYVRFNILYIN